jgi:hypothetical protein
VPVSRSSHAAEPPLAMFYSDPSMTPCSSISSFNSQSNSNDLHASSSSSSQYSSSVSFYNDMPETPKTFSSSSGYESNIPTSDSFLNSIPDHLFLSSPDSLIMPPPPVPSPKLPVNSDRNLVEQFIDLHLQKQTSFDQDGGYSPPSSFSSTSSSFLSQAPISTINSPICCRKCINNEDKNQLSSDTEDDSQSTTITTNLLPLQQQQQQNKRPRSLPIAIQQPKGLTIETNNNNDDDDDDDDDFDNSLQNSLTCHCSIISSRKKRFRTCEFNHQPILNVGTSANGLFSENTLITSTTDKLHIDLKDIDDQNNNEQSPIKQQKNSLEHFIMSPTDKVKVQMKYPPLNNDKEGDIKSVSTSFSTVQKRKERRDLQLLWFYLCKYLLQFPERI